MTSAAAQARVPALRADVPWTPQDAAELYGIHLWGQGFLDVSPEGRLLVLPEKDPNRAIDLYDLIRGLQEREINTPVLLRFSDLLHTRLRELRRAFDDAIREHDYGGSYACVYPIKVNQQRTVVEELREFAKELGFGLEAGSKPELLAVLGITEGSGLNGHNLPIVCNGFKDDEYIETCILAHKLGRDITPIVESEHELDLILKQSQRYGVRPKIGIRVKPSARGAGKWASSGGMRSKFGLHVSQVLRALDKLKAAGMADCLRLVHFHVGSQLCDIRQLKNAVTELAHIYAELIRLGATGLDTIDIGGGLAVDYDGSGSTWVNSMNYTVQEYASDVVYRIKATCDVAGVRHPRILSESGRAMVTHASVLVTDVLSAGHFPPDPDLAWIKRTMESEEKAGQEIPQPLLDLHDAYDRLKRGEDPYEAYHDTVAARDEAITLFGLGYLSLPLRACCERLFWSIGHTLLARAENDEDLKAATHDLPDLLSDIYFCNFSLFQSLPDSWAIDQLFPIVPIHRLDERPTRRAVIADITCDSDGQIDRFSSPDGDQAKTALELHELEKMDDPEASSGGIWHKPYYLGIFLVGAYQEVLGDLHNLFGDTHAVHVTLDEDGHVSIDEFIPGDTVREVLEYVQFDIADLREAMRKDIERATKQGRMSIGEGKNLMKFYEGGLDGYTYLE